MLSGEEKARLVWNCRRGMLELDLIFNNFLNKGLELLNSKQLAQFKNLLDHTDPELFAWLMGHEEPSNTELASIVTFIRAHS